MITRLLSLLFVFVTVSCQQSFDFSSCSNDKGCLFSPPGCTPGRDCQIHFSYLQDSDYLNMEIFGQVGGNEYLAIGFSKDNTMGDDSVVTCTSMNGQGGVGLSYNENGQRTNRMINSNGLQSVSAAQVINGNAYCNFRQLLKPKTSNVFDLNKDYVILMARGPVNQAGGLGYHQTSRYVLPRTDLRIYKRKANGTTVIGNVRLNDDVPRTTNDKLMVAHGILMTLSWSIFLATGILFARHFKGHFPDSTVCGIKMWFHLHRTINMIGIAGTICGFVMIFVAKDWRWVGPKAYATTEENQAWGSIHAMLGLLACVVAWAQPLMAVFRCSPDHKARFIFNWIHRFLGAGAFLMALAATMIATRHFEPMFSNRKAAMGLYIAYLATLGIVLILLEVLGFKNWWANRGRVGTEIEMHRIGSSLTEVDENTEKVRRLQVLVLLLFVAISIGLSVAICTLIGLKPKMP